MEDELDADGNWICPECDSEGTSSGRYDSEGDPIGCALCGAVDGSD